GSACPPGKKTSRVSATDAIVVERFEIAISNIKELQDWLSNSGARDRKYDAHYPATKAVA
ncbi:MAG: hypothetical protein ACYCY0_11745, partial [Acidithiobacillus ferrivorans]